MKKQSARLAQSYKPKKKRELRINKILVALVLIASLAVVAEITGLTNFYSTNNQATDNQDKPVDKNAYTPPTEQEKKEVEDSKTNPASPPSANPSTLPDKKIVIASAEQSGGKLVVKTELYGVGWQTCKLSVSKGSSLVEKTAEVLYQADFSTCMGFSVPVSELSEAGNWSVKLTSLKSDGTSEASEVKTVSIVK